MVALGDASSEARPEHSSGPHTAPDIFHWAGQAHVSAVAHARKRDPWEDNDSIIQTGTKIAKMTIFRGVYFLVRIMRDDHGRASCAAMTQPKAEPAGGTWVSTRAV